MRKSEQVQNIKIFVRVYIYINIYAKPVKVRLGGDQRVYFDGRSAYSGLQ